MMAASAIAASVLAHCARARMRVISWPTRSAEQAIQIARRRVRRSQSRRIEALVAMAGRKAEEAEHPQPVLGDAGRRVADEAHASVEAIGKPAERIEQCPVRRAIEGVEREVAPPRILGPSRCRSGRRRGARRFRRRV